MCLVMYTSKIVAVCGCIALKYGAFSVNKPPAIVHLCLSGVLDHNKMPYSIIGWLKFSMQ